LKVIKTNLLDRHFGNILNNLFEKRERSDYSIYSFLDADITNQLLQDATSFREGIKYVLNEKFNLEL
jgi:uncharacterized protein (UPF0332 family)